MGFMFTAYNLSRIINILGFKALHDYLKEVVFYSFAKFIALKLKIPDFEPFNFLRYFRLPFFKNVLERHSFDQLLIKLGSF